MFRHAHQIQEEIVHALEFCIQINGTSVEKKHFIPIYSAFSLVKNETIPLPDKINKRLSGII